MCADNLTKCPKCVEKIKAEYSKNICKLEESYGKVPSSEYVARLNELKKPLVYEDTLHEDCEQGICNGIYNVSFSAHCSKCGLKYEYHFSEKVYTKE